MSAQITAPTAKNQAGFVSALKSNDALMAAAVMTIVAMMIIPLPALLLDILITLNVAATVTVLLVSMLKRRHAQLELIGAFA